MLLISKIELPAKQDPVAFGEFMRDEYFPAVHKGPTRVGQVEELELLQSTSAERSHMFLWLLSWNGLAPAPTFWVDVDDEDVQHRFEGFGASVKPHVTWHEVAKWPQPTS
jgi:ribosomal protein S12 methylthiotransferase accessory factor YcaO